MLTTGKSALVSVYDMAGAKVASFATVAGESVNLELEAGIYLLVAKTADTTETLKISK
ncbi:MAG: T9SS type A sorting domain-containing protein [Muribaculaceae bacterium]|nr:T9SS type A sorting domain-containing protein [Muribaculaceae bacterium]